MYHNNILKYNIIYIKSLGQMAYNVQGMRRLGQVIGLCEANVPCSKCGGDKTA